VHRTDPDFWLAFETLPESVQRIARRNFARLKEDPQYPSLQFKKVGDYWSARVGSSYRALAVEDSGDFTWVWIGTHAEYDQMT
jgi:hypothetical protein